VKFLRFVVLFVITVAVGGAALGGSLALLAPAGAEFKDVTDFSPIDPATIISDETSFMFDRSGNLMTELFAEEDRTPITLEEVPQNLIDAVIAIEDRKFYEHEGVDWNGVARALFQNLDAGEVQQGGSTITQQLVKVTMTDPKQDRDLQTKVQEAAVAIRLEDAITKDEILERYLNVIYLGNGAYGVQSAATRYWDKDPKDLTLGEAALLAALIQAPENLNPVTHPDRAARRRALVLDAMVETNVITQVEADFANLEPLPTQARNPDKKRDFFTTEVIEVLLNDDPNVEGDVAEYLGATQAARYNAVFRGGLNIHTTYDQLIDFIALSSVKEILPDGEVVASVVVIDNKDLSVRAMYPGFDFSELEYNPITTTGRQTGSSFKAITLATALDAGYSPRDRVGGNTVTIERPGEDYTANCSGGTLTLTNAIAKSNNCAFIRTITSLGPGHFGDDGAERVKEMAGKLGIDTSKLDAVPAMTLGTSDTNMLDMAEAFATFANEGVHLPPIFVTKIEGPDGDVIYEADQEGDRVLQPQDARTLTSMLSEVVKSGTGTRADIGRPQAGKTGTTDDNSDAWFVGYTAQYTVAVWMGYPHASRSMNEFGINNVQGGRQPALIWNAIMTPLHRDLPVVEFTAPDEKLWPTGQRVTEHGREFTRDFISDDTVPPTTSEVPPGETTVPPDVTTVVPPPPVTSAPPPTSPPATSATPAPTVPVTQPPQTTP